jgi:serine/threonine protein kinase
LSAKENFDHNYRFGHVLGEGRWFWYTVYAATRVCDGLPVAIKKVKRSSITSWCQVNNAIVPLEYSLLRQVSQCSGVVKLLDACDAGDAFYLVMETMESYAEIYLISSQNKTIRLYPSTWPRNFSDK